VEEKENGNESKEKIKARGKGKIGGKGNTLGVGGHEVEFQKAPYSFFPLCSSDTRNSLFCKINRTVVLIVLI